MEPELLEVVELGWGPEQRVDRIEGSCAALFGEPPEALLGRPLAELVPFTPAALAEFLGALSARPRERHVTFVSARRADRRVLHWRLAAVQGPDGRVRAQLLDLERLLEGAPPLQIGKLSSSLSHEIRNPLSSVKMAVQTVARVPGLSERDQRRLSIANREIRTMERMLWLLSEYGREPQGGQEPVALRTLVQEALAMVEPELQERQFAFDVREPPELPKVRADAARLRPVLGQLLLNVAVCQPPGARLPLVLRQAASAETACELELTDPHSPLPPEERSTLFEPFGSRLSRGAGLSLAALHRLLTGIGGAITAEPDAGGTRFLLRFPT